MAYDTNNNSASTSRSYLVIDDPRMTVQGQVLDKLSNPVNGVSITVDGVQVITGSDGRYLVENVPATELSLTVEASTLFGNQQMLASSAAFAPVRNGVVDVETLVLHPSALELSLDNGRSESASFPYLISGTEGRDWTVNNRGSVGGAKYHSGNGSRLYINNSEFLGEQFSSEQSGRQTAITGRVGEIDVTRRAYLSETGTTARILEEFYNPTDSSVSVSMSWHSAFVRISNNWAMNIYNNSRQKFGAEHRTSAPKVVVGHIYTDGSRKLSNSTWDSGTRIFRLITTVYPFQLVKKSP